MTRRTKEQVAEDNANKRAVRADKMRPNFIASIIKYNKFLREKKYHKNNYWSIADWQSWAARGQAGSCGCGVGHYNNTLYNKRAKTGKGGKGGKYGIPVSQHVCTDCAAEIENYLQTKFNKKHCS